MKTTWSNWMKIDPSRAIGAYAAVATLACAWLAFGAQVAAPKLATLDVARINVREPDGTLRMTISNAASAPGIIIGRKEYPHPSRKSAGLLFFNDEGIENGGLIFDGRKRNGKVSGGGSLTFDRYLQDQVVQIIADENGKDRLSGLRVFDRPDGEMDYKTLYAAKPQSDAERQALYARTNMSGGKQRGFFGRAVDGSSRVELRDASGNVRLALRVAADGTAALDFLDPAGKVVRSVTP